MHKLHPGLCLRIQNEKPVQWFEKYRDIIGNRVVFVFGTRSKRKFKKKTFSQSTGSTSVSIFFGEMICTKRSVIRPTENISEKIKKHLYIYTHIFIPLYMFLSVLFCKRVRPKIVKTHILTCFYIQRRHTMLKLCLFEKFEKNTRYGQLVLK